jgi:predicted membrane protein
MRCSLCGRNQKSIQDVVLRKTEVMRALGRTKWNDNIKMYLNIVVFEDVNWMNVAQDRAQG